MYYIIGKYKEGHSIVGLKLYDSDKNQTGLYYKDQVMKAACKYNLKIGGIKDKVCDNGKRKKVLSYTIYSVNMLDEVDCNGNPINDNHVRVIYKVKGFKDSMEITLLDSRGNLEVVDLETLMRLIEERKVTGFKKGKNIVFSKWCIIEGIKCEEEQTKKQLTNGGN